MVKRLDDIDENLIKEISSTFIQTKDFDLLKRTYPDINHILLLSILYECNIPYNELLPFLCVETIDDKKILLLSDTHYGSRYENRTLVDTTFEFAVMKGYHVVIHGGDIIDGNCSSKRMECEEQVEYFNEVYPKDKNIVTYAICGNHEYSAFLKNEALIKTLFSRDDVNMLDFKIAYLNWRGNIIKLKHHISNYPVWISPWKSEVCFKGHSHFYHTNTYKEKTPNIHIPALCEDPCPLSTARKYIKKYKLNTSPGFLTAELVNGAIVVDFYSIKNNHAVREHRFARVLRNNK